MKTGKAEVARGERQGVAVLQAGLTCFCSGAQTGGRWFHRWQLLWGRRSERG